MIKPKARRSETGAFGPAGSRCDAPTPRRRFRQGAALILALCLATLAFSASAQASGDTAEAWGYNFDGQLGNGSSTGPDTCPDPCSKSPLQVNALSGATAITAGGEHSLALLQNGTVMAWGENTSGQLGNGNNTGPDNCGGDACSKTPITVGGLSGVVAIAAGDFQSLALLQNGTVMAWGDNSLGEVGNGTTTDSSTPVQVSGLSGVVAIAAGGHHSLGLLSNGTVMAWGQNNNGELGIGNNTGPDTCGSIACSKLPVPVSGLSGVMALTAGISDSHSQALLSNGTVMAWGENSYGQLGTGSSTGPNTCGGNPCGTSPVPVSGLSGVVEVAAGWNHSLARLANGSGMAWGGNSRGQLGIGTNDGANHPTPLAISGLSGATALTGGDLFNLAILSNGTVTAWGRNPEGQLGNGTTTESDQPGLVSGLSSATAIAAGFNHSLALVGPSQALSVSLAGAGSGVVGGPGVLCPPSCSHSYPQGATQNLLAQPAAGTGFAGFSGACTGTGPCRVTMNQDQSVTATFGPPKGTTITKAKLKRRKRLATFSFTAPGAITGFECELQKPRRRHHKKPKPHFSACGSPKRYRHLRPGKYTFKVRALDILGSDATPAIRKFRFKH